jgi:hypothetical protein
MSADVVAFPGSSQPGRRFNAEAEKAAQDRINAVCNVIRSFEDLGYGRDGDMVRTLARCAEMFLRELRDQPPPKRRTR